MRKLRKFLMWLLVIVVVVALIAISVWDPPLLPWILLVLVLLAWWLTPVRGLIGQVAVPPDDAFLPEEQVQWWYWSGHLQTDEGRRFGFEVVFFTFYNFPLLRDQLVHAAITDVDANSFAFEEFVEFLLPPRLRDAFKFSSGKGNKVTASGSDVKDPRPTEAVHRDHLHSEVRGRYVLDLDLETKTVAVHCDGGPVTYAGGGFTYYYSRPLMQASGTLTIDGRPHHVTGTAWFDRQYGELFQAVCDGWQWFAIQLDDNTQIMISDYRGTNAASSMGSTTDASGLTRRLHQDEFNVQILGYWTSPATGIVYPSGWEVTVRGQTFNIQPLVKDQELAGKHRIWFGLLWNMGWVGPEYWEGCCSVTGDVSGKAYVELNGFTPPGQL